MSLKISSVLKDASKVTIQDSTTYTTPVRSDYYSHFYAYKVDENDQETALAVTSQGTPTSQATWEVTTPTDGHHRFKLLLYVVWNGTDTFEVGNIVNRNGNYYIANTQNTNDDPATNVNSYWTAHTATVADEDVSNVTTTTLNCVLFYRLKTCYAKEVAAAASIACECSNDKKPAEIQRYERMAVLIDGIAVDDYQQRFSDGEKKVRYMAKMCSNCS